MIKLTKHEWEAFINSKDKTIWPDDAYMDDVYITYSDGEEVDDESERFKNSPAGTVLKLESGWVCNHPTIESLELLLKKWRKLQTHEIVSIQIPKGFDIKALLKGTECKLLK